MQVHAYLATSLDGFLARADGALDWLPQPSAQEHEQGQTQDPQEDYGFAEFLAGMDALIMGRLTFDTVREFADWPYGETPVVVLSRTLTDTDLRAQWPQQWPGHLPVRLHPGPLPELLDSLRAEGVQRVYADGGQVVQALIRAGLLDELTLTTVPVLLGSGRRLFGETSADIPLSLISSRVHAGGLVQSRYQLGKSRAETHPSL